MIFYANGDSVFVAVCSFEGCEPGDLSFEEGDYITLIAKVLPPPIWWVPIWRYSQPRHLAGRPRMVAGHVQRPNRSLSVQPR